MNEHSTDKLALDYDYYKVKDPEPELDYSKLTNEKLSFEDRSDLPPNIRNKLKEITSNYVHKNNSTNFWKQGMKVPMMRIPLSKTHKLWTEKLRPIAPKFEAQFRKELDEQVKLGIVTPSSSEVASGIVIVARKDTERVRLVVDYRKMNENILNDLYPIPNQRQILYKVLGKKYHTMLDLRNAFYQGIVHPDDRWTTAFLGPTGLFEYNRIPMGTKRSPPHFQRSMDMIFSDLIADGILVVYLDDIDIVSDSMEEHIEHIQRAINKCIEYRLFLNLKKCEWIKTEIKFLGHKISYGLGLGVNDLYINKILDLGIPTTQGGLKALVGLFSYYRANIRDCAHKMKPFYDEMKKIKSYRKHIHANYPISWTPEMDRNYEILKRDLTDPQFLQAPDMEKPFYLYTDASDYGIGYVLTQIQEGFHRFIDMNSRTLSPADRGRCPTDRELRGIQISLIDIAPICYGCTIILSLIHI